MNPRDFILSRSGSVRRTREGYWAYWPDPLPPQIDWSPALLANLSAAERSLGELTATIRLTPDSDLFAPLLVAREACHSCQIDGIHVDYQELLQSQLIPGSPFADSKEIRHAKNYITALSSAANATALESGFTLDLLTQTHRALLGDLSGSPGTYRSEQNWIGPAGSTPDSAVFVPPPPDRLLRGLEQLTAFITSNADLPQLIKHSLIHYQFEALHPFSHGNGRLGRILISSLPVLGGDLPAPVLPTSGFLLDNRARYFDLLLAVSQRSAWNDWLVFFLQAISTSAQETIRLLRDLESFHQQSHKALSVFRTAPRLQQLLNIVIDQPIFTVRQVESAMDVNFAVAQRYVNQFEELGFVEEITGQARNRIYRAPEMVAILTKTMYGG